MKRINILYILKIIIAFCSIVYELILAQSLSAFLENTVLRYSVTIGLYMFSMGMGSLMAEGRFLKFPLLNLLKVEILLTVIGGFSLIWLHLADCLILGRWFFIVFAHVLIFGIGFLTGFEIPLVIEIRNKEKEHSENTVLAADYAGAVIGSIFFAFYFYPSLGLMHSAFFIGFLNAFAGLLLLSQRKKLASEEKPGFKRLIVINSVFFAVLFFCLFNADRISDFFIKLYLR